MPITQPPSPPTLADPSNFNARAESFISWLQTFAAEVNAMTPGESAAGLAQYLASTAAGKGSALVAVSELHTTSGTVGGALNAYTFVFGDGSTDCSAALAAANARGRPVVIVGTAHVASATTLTVPVVDTLSQIFTTTSQITLSAGSVRPEWFGLTAGCIPRAIAALPSTGGVVQLEARTYPPCGHAYNGSYISKAGVTLRGAKMPRLTADCRALEAGTIIQGTLLGYADAMELRDLGVDAGKTYCDASNGGAPLEGLILTYPSDALKAAAALRRGLRLHNVIGLAYSPTAAVHAVIAAEGYSDATLSGEVIGCMGVHGVVVKASGVHAAQLSAYCNGSDGVIIKSAAQATARATGVQIDRIMTRAGGPDGTTPHAVATTGFGLLFHAEGGDVSGIEIGALDLKGHPQSVSVLHDSTAYMIEASIGQMTADTNATAGLNLTTAGKLRFNIGTAHFKSVTLGATFQFSNPAGTPNRVTIGQLCTTGATDVSIAIGSQSYVDIGQHVATDCSKAYRFNGTPKLQAGSLSLNNTPVVYDTSSGGLAPALANGWTQVASNDPFGVDLTGGRVNLRGLVRPGTSNVLTTLPQWAWPLSVKRFMAQGYNGTTVTAAPVTVSTDGTVRVNEVAGGYANVGGAGGWLSLSGISWDQQA